MVFAVQMSLLAVWVAMAGAACASAEPSTTGAQQLHDVNQNSAEGQAILKTAAADVKGQIGKDAKFAVTSFKASQGWAFLSAQLQNPDGSPFDYAGTPLAEASANGGASKRYVGLLRSNPTGAWDVVTSAVGATAPVWTEWAQEYSAPAELFGS